MVEGAATDFTDSEIKYSACIKAFEMATFLDGRLLFVKENIKICSLCNKIFSQFWNGGRETISIYLIYNSLKNCSKFLIRKGIDSEERI